MDVNIILFPDFETLDVFGPVEMLGHLEEYHLNFLSIKGGLIKSRQNLEVMTKPIDTKNYSGILVLPGGQGTRTLVEDLGFIELIKQLAQASDYCLTVCTGSALLARTNLLNGRKATSNKKAFAWVESVNPQVKWVSAARWVVDGIYYTSSGVSAGMDMTLGFIADRFGTGKARAIADSTEYQWSEDKDKDPFSKNNENSNKTPVKSV
ncbi:DJ-1/PfpI family protein [Anaerocolumna jejuensis DSM 15929]|uniref:DJ-1/PfpI family protein n=1 Tax=Anaerocolumna jejuensis DSM 15929 TaxID=1121322 RepID=A0A1M6JFU8_9FIRM|nr:DJ-1/PfpI family protein [Anaerocolumna jejuensis]SHJ45589.1 DJ-1/PfpI family protein [Anaerocolumna jejuensis DSM 15929]